MRAKHSPLPRTSLRPLQFASRRTGRTAGSLRYRQQDRRDEASQDTVGGIRFIRERGVKKVVQRGEVLIVRRYPQRREQQYHQISVEIVIEGIDRDCDFSRCHDEAPAANSRGAIHIDQTMCVRAGAIFRSPDVR